MKTIDLNEILRLPITTNRLVISVNKQALLEKFAVVSYYSFDKEYKNLAYEQLADVPFISVTGIRARWEKDKFPYTKFFILTNKDRLSEVLGSLRSFDKIYSTIDNLDYSERLIQRVVASLAINALGEVNNTSPMLYNDGSLLLCDDKNFLVSRSKKELVCLKIEVNEYLNLIARTVSFSNPRSKEHLRKNSNCVFQVSNDLHGQWWSGLAVKPVVVRKLKNENLRLEELYIKSKRFSDSHNIVPYWPYNPDNYSHGRLAAIFQVMERANERFASFLQMDFSDHQVIKYDEYRSEKQTIDFLQQYFEGRTIIVEDPFATGLSKQYVQSLQSAIMEVCDGVLFSNLSAQNALLIRLCEPKEDEDTQSKYTQSLQRLSYDGVPIQHVIFDANIENSISKSQARRILLELLVKDCLALGSMPDSLSVLLHDWECLRYKINMGNVVGASLLTIDNKIQISDYGLSLQGMPLDFDSFARDILRFDNPDLIKGSRDYKVMKKNGNVFLIIDTDEIPILDLPLIDNGYDAIINKGEVLSMFKRKKCAHDYLRGYIGFHLWKSEGLNGEENAAYSYIAGVNSENMQILRSSKMDRVPRARRIFILRAEHSENIENQIMEIVGMLKMGLGRWNELMTYPFPFKFLQEHLDNVCEIAYSKHWNDISSSTILL